MFDACCELKGGLKAEARERDKTYSSNVVRHFVFFFKGCCSLGLLLFVVLFCKKKALAQFVLLLTFLLSGGERRKEALEKIKKF